MTFSHNPTLNGSLPSSPISLFQSQLPCLPKSPIATVGRRTSVLAELVAKRVHDHRPSHNSLAWFDSTIL
ncbi:hypothetical protein Csa_009888 [Cucumis sativus]|uniref:Uncharacterized protein n=1 Tax=Cucumis sativus TaxID=3659 RepID=A0A0A0LAB1_CUCSA|nr:hypothetical protein Csa_009888 [Cucumis sativus]